MSRIQVRIKAPFGELLVEAENPAEALKTLETFPEGFAEKISELVSNRVAPSILQLKGIVEQTTEGPVIIAHENLASI